MDDYQNQDGMTDQDTSPYSQPQNQNIPDPMPQYTHIPPTPVPKTNSMAVAALTMGILSLVFMIMGMSLPFAALGIMFALLSRREENMPTQSKVGMGLSIAGCVLGIIFLVTMIIAALHSDTMQDIINGNITEDELEEYIEYYLGEDLDEDFDMDPNELFQDFGDDISDDYLDL